MSEEIEERIRELKLVKTAIKEKELSKQRTEERLKLLDHPFVKRLGDTLKEASFMQIRKARKQMYEASGKQREEAKGHVYKKVSWLLKSEGEGVTEPQLTDMIRKILSEQKRIEGRQEGII